MELEAISPLSAYMVSFVDLGLPVWLVVFFGVIAYWFVYFMPMIFVLNYMDRKIGPDLQMRIGPNRVGPGGILQGFADGWKRFFKEEVRPELQEPFLFLWAPLFSLVCVFVALVTVPMSRVWSLADLSSGLVFVICTLTLSYLSLFWASYSVKGAWSVLSSFRMIAVTSNYLVPLVFSVLPPILIAGSINLRDIVAAQGGSPLRWIFFHNPGTLLSGAAFFFSLYIWQSQDPLSFARSKSEVHEGVFGEYSGVRRGTVKLLDRAGFLLACSLMVCLYFGGGNTPMNLESFGRAANIVEWFFFLAKTLALAFFSIWFKWSLPRMRIDQIVRFSWRLLVPAGFAGTIITALWLALTHGRGIGDLL